MAIVRSEAIVLHHRDQGETSRIVNLFTLLYGKVSLIAKGARTIKSRFGGALEPFTHLTVVFYKKDTRELQFLNQADILNPFLHLHSQLGRIALANIPCEIVERYEIAGHPHSALFRLLLETLAALDQGDTGLRSVVRAFQLKFAELSGFRPRLTYCSQCGKEMPEGQVIFDYETGSYRCADCPSAATAGDRLSGFSLNVLRYLQQAPMRLAAQARVNPSQGEEIDHILEQFLGYHMESLNHLASIKHLRQLHNSVKLK